MSIIDQKQGVFILNVYKENGGPVRSFCIAKTSVTASPIINTLLKKDVDNCSLDLSWTDKIYLRVSDAKHNGRYMIRWT